MLPPRAVLDPHCRNLVSNNRGMVLELSGNEQATADRPLVGAQLHAHANSLKFQPRS